MKRHVVTIRPHGARGPDVVGQPPPARGPAGRFTPVRSLRAAAAAGVLLFASPVADTAAQDVPDLAGYDVFVPARKRAESDPPGTIYVHSGEAPRGTISLHLSDAPVREALREIATSTGYRVGIEKEVDRRVTMSVDGVKLSEALQALIDQTGLVTSTHRDLILFAAPDRSGRFTAIAGMMLIVVSIILLFGLAYFVTKSRENPRMRTRR